MAKKTVDKRVFAERLQSLMREQGETTYSIADLTNLTAPTISRYLSGEIGCKATTIEAIARRFEVDPAWLMGYDVPRYKTAPDLPAKASAATPPSAAALEVAVAYDEAPPPIKAAVRRVLNLSAEDI